MSERDIQPCLEQADGTELSYAAISRITDGLALAIQVLDDQGYSTYVAMRIIGSVPKPRPDRDLLRRLSHPRPRRHYQPPRLAAAPRPAESQSTGQLGIEPQATKVREGYLDTIRARMCWATGD
jgi:hypothetical protein